MTLKCLSMIKTTTGLQAFSQKLVFWKKNYFTKMTRTPPISGQYEPLRVHELVNHHGE